MPEDPETQMRNAFGKIGDVLCEAGLTFRSVVEMVRYRVALRDHFHLFDSNRLEHHEEP